MAVDVVESFKEEIRPCPLGEEIITDSLARGDSELNRARSNKFTLIIDIPQCFKKLETDTARSNRLINTNKVQMNVWGSVTPQISVPSIEVPAYAGVVKVSSHSKPAYETVTVDFTVDNNYENYHAIYRWLDILSDDKISVYDGKDLLNDSAGNFGEYSTIWTLYALDEFNKNIAKWEFWGAYPTQLGQIQWSKRDPSDIESQLSFDFTFLNFEIL